MITLVKFDNPFKTRDHTIHTTTAGGDLWDVLGRTGIDQFDGEMTVILNGKHLPEFAWGNEIHDGAILGVCPRVGFGGFAIYVAIAVATAALSIALTLAVGVPETPEGDEADPMYSLKGHSNQNRFGNPIESHYGLVRVWPSAGAQAYNRIISNDAWRYTLYCIGQGEYQIEEVDDGEGGTRPDISIEDTNIADFEDIEVEVIPPNSEVTLFRDNVQTSTEVGGNELFGVNEKTNQNIDGTDYWVYEFIANDAGTLTDLLEVDITLPQGLYQTRRKKKKLRTVTVTATFDYIEVDDLGAEIGSWQTLANFSKTKATVNPQRYTLSQPVSPGRYKIRAYRTGNASTSHTVGNKMVWDAMRAFLPNIGSYGDVTMLAMKARATSNLNDTSKNRVNLRVTRELDGVPTRSLVAAFRDVFYADYAGGISDPVLDEDSLDALDTELNAAGIYFDWTFDAESTVWAAAQTVARACRGVPILDGSQVYIVRDTPKTQLNQLFNAENIVEDSFSYNMVFARSEDHDAVEAEYLDPVTWKRETVTCTFPGSAAVNPKKVTMVGIADRDRAYQEGMYILATMLLQREEIKFSTGSEALTATYGDFIQVEYHAMGVKEAVGGSVLSIAGDRLSVTLSTDVAFGSGAYKISLTGVDGIPYKYTATAGATANEVVVDTPISANVVINNNSEPPRFIFGEQNTLAKECVITGITPSADNTVDVTTIVYDPSVYDYDATPAPPKPADLVSPVPALPVVTGVKAEQTGDTLYKVTWESAEGATSYIVQMSDDPTQYDTDPNEAWETVGTAEGTFLEITALMETLYLRVAGVNTGQGPWAYFDIYIAGNTRITENTESLPSNTRVTEDGNTRVTEEEDE